MERRYPESAEELHKVVHELRGEDAQPAERDGGCQPQAQEWCEESPVRCKEGYTPWVKACSESKGTHSMMF